MDYDRHLQRQYPAGIEVIPQARHTGSNTIWAADDLPQPCERPAIERVYDCTYRANEYRAMADSCRAANRWGRAAEYEDLAEQIDAEAEALRAQAIRDLESEVRSQLATPAPPPEQPDRAAHYRTCARQHRWSAALYEEGNGARTTHLRRAEECDAKADDIELWGTL